MHPSIGEYLWIQQQQAERDRWLRSEVASGDAATSGINKEQEREHQWAALVLRASGG